MGRRSAYVTAPYQGISQAPPQVRLLEQAENIQDAMLSLAEGATKRPPMTYLGVLEDHPGDADGLFFMATRPTPEGDVIGTATLESGHIVPRVYQLSDLTQLPVDLTDADAQAYLDSGITTPADSLRSLTVEDFTFLTNRKVTVAKSGDTAATRHPEGLVWVRQGAYGRTYTATVLDVDGNVLATCSYHTPDGSVATSSSYVDTSVIAEALSIGTINGTSVVPDGGSITGAGLDNDLTPLGFHVFKGGAVISIVNLDDVDFSIQTIDGQDSTAMVPVKDKVANFSDLPKKAFNGFTVRISQGTATDKDDFFVHYNVDTSTWEECIAPGAELGYDPNLLPVALINDPDLPGWRIKANAWLPRATGDQTLNPDPDFVGAVVEDMTFWKGRVAIVAREGITLSGSDDPFRLYPQTLATELDDDPLGFLSPYPDVSLLRYGIPFDDRLVGFGDKCQVKIETPPGQPIKPGATDIGLLQTYEFSQALRPQGANGRVYFAAPKGDTASAIYELAVDSAVTNKTDAEDLTLAIPKLIPAGIDRVANCPVNSLLVYGVTGGTKLYPHIVRFANGQRVQNAANVWNLPPGYTLGGMFFKNTTLYLLLCDGTAAHVVTMDLAPNVKDDGTGAVMLTHLDLRIKSENSLVTLNYSHTFDQTVVTLPYPVGDNPKASVRAPGGTGGLGNVSGGMIVVTEGFAPQVITSRSTHTLTPYQFVLNGKWDECPLWLGLSYTMRVQPTRIYLFGKDSRPMRGGRLQIGKLAVDLADTGYFRAEVTPRGRATRSYGYEGYRLDDPLSIFNAPPNSTTVLSVPVRCENEQAVIEFVNDSHFGSKLLGFEWFGDFNHKATRVT